MPKSTVAQDDPYPLPENVLLPLQLKDCRQVSVPFTKKDGTSSSFLKWEWDFDIVGGEFQGLELRGGSEPKVTNATESAFLPLARPIVEALLGRSLELGEEVDTDLLIGRQAQGTAKHLPPRERKQGDGYWFNCELDEIFPSYEAMQTQAGQQAAQQPAWGTPPPAAPVGYDEPPF